MNDFGKLFWNYVSRQRDNIKNGIDKTKMDYIKNFGLGLYFQMKLFNAFRWCFGLMKHSTE